MKGWAADRANRTFAFNSPLLRDHMAKGGNYGICTDEDRFVVGCDTKEVELAVEQRLPKTFTVRTPRHKTKHFYFYGKLTNDILTKPTAQGDPCADIKRGNAYVLGSGSEFEGFGKYEVADDLPIATITEEELTSAINEFIESKKPDMEPTDTQTRNPELNFPILKILSGIDGLSHNGNEIAGPHPIHGSTTGTNFHVTTTKNVWHCFRHNTGGGPLELLAVLNDIIKCEDAVKGALRGEKFGKTVEKAKELGLVPKDFFLISQVDSRYVEIDEDGHASVKFEPILSDLTRENRFKTPTDLEDIYAYEDGVYVEVEWKVKATLEKWLGMYATTNIVNEVLNHIRRLSYVDRSIFNKFDGSLPVQNGLLDLIHLKLKPFDEKRIYTYKLNVAYDPTKKCPKWEGFLTQILAKEDAAVLQEYMGYCLLPAMPYHVVMWFYGKGRNGKGRITKTLEYIFGKQNIANLDLAEFSGDRRFSTAQLYGKLINVASEPGTTKTLQTPLLKKLTGEDFIDAEVKNKQKRLVFMNIAKFYILGNRFPKVNDTTLAFWDRVLLLNFPNSFTGVERIPNIEKTWLDDKDEVSGIINWMIEGLLRLVQNNDFTKSKSQTETILEFKKVSDTIGAWLEEKCVFELDQKLDRKIAYEDYKEYADSLGTSPETQNVFYARLRETPKIKDSQVKPGKTPVRIWQGIRLKTEKELGEPTQPTLDGMPTTIPLPNGNTSNIGNKQIEVEKTEEVSQKGKECSPVTCVTCVTNESTWFFEHCYFCQQPIWTDDWVTDDFTAYKPAHRECYEKQRAMVKKAWML